LHILGTKPIPLTRANKEGCVSKAVKRSNKNEKKNMLHDELNTVLRSREAKKF
jgi:hypothetical protein